MHQDRGKKGLPPLYTEDTVHLSHERNTPCSCYLSAQLILSIPPRQNQAAQGQCCHAKTIVYGTIIWEGVSFMSRGDLEILVL